ncbi:unnamed protein product, partial [Ectocarpus sp. 8 AP-2014]
VLFHKYFVRRCHCVLFILQDVKNGLQEVARSHRETGCSLSSCSRNASGPASPPRTLPADPWAFSAVDTSGSPPPLRSPRCWSSHGGEQAQSSARLQGVSKTV